MTTAPISARLGRVALITRLLLVCLGRVLQSEGMETGGSELRYYSQMGSPENSTLSDEKLMEIFNTFAHSCALIPPDKATILVNLRDSLKRMKQMNMTGVTFGLNCMSLLSEKQFQESLNTHVPPRLPPGGIPVPASPRASSSSVHPESFDWRDAGRVTSVKDEGPSGCSWTFAAVGALEGAVAVQSGRLVSLSEQNLVDCATQTSGCRGGWMTVAYKYVESSQGINTDEIYPYRFDKDGISAKPCLFKGDVKVNVFLSGYGYIATGSESDLLHSLLTVGPIATAVDGTQMQHYKSGVFKCGGSSPNHGVLIVGYGVDTSSGEKYWTVKNSWGPSWGNSGYIQIARDSQNACGITSHANFPNFTD